MYPVLALVIPNESILESFLSNIVNTLPAIFKLHRCHINAFSVPPTKKFNLPIYYELGLTAALRLKESGRILK